MTAYLTIFEGWPYALVILASLAIMSAVVFKSSFIFRSMLISSGTWLAPIFYLLYVAITKRISPEVCAAFLVEMLFLAAYLMLLSKLLSCIGAMTRSELEPYIRWFKVGIYVQLPITVFLLAQEGFGIFSEGSRLEYIEYSRLNAYLTYAVILIGEVSMPIAAAIVSKSGRWDGWVLVYIVLAMTISVLSGSKGGALMQVVGLLCFIKLRKPAQYFKLLRVPVVLGIAFLGLTIVYVGQFLLLDPGTMISLMFSRVFLANDARALAIDFAGLFNNGSYALFREAFRSLASILGNSPVNLPLGQLLYAEAFDTIGLIGANASSTALLIAYGGAVEKFLFMIVLLMMLAVLVAAARTPGLLLFPRLAVGLALVILLSQDFLAFQVCANITAAAIVVLFLLRIIRSTIVFASKRSLIRQ